ncbi:PucR family transcriptional regulator [Acidaminobacter hydrogenoformans]|uniref:Sugar diacid utilization regulator n=1 Tax=Acidaminobacter hydrogenoformans DSM 2784 TaxID=1120920 RepID=A0A1G5RXA1_9FIRM|nr:PucR family transcriptional regulator [Acidaminobacter hydrogenoformans]SCZ77959.1 Sugar diacid utilization regulator [Acidaminobacter hydrogenoformans DSM 2784]
MDITVSEALMIGKLKEGKLVAGETGLNNVIKSVSVIEVPSATSWYRGGELQLSALYSIGNDDEKLRQLLLDLSKHNCAGLVVCHFGVWLKKISYSNIELANDLGFPIITLPKHIAYIDIIMPLVDRILERKNRMLEYSLKVHDEMTKAVIDGMNLADLVELLSNLIKKPVLMIDPYDEYFMCENIKTFADDKIVCKIHDWIINNITNITKNKYGIFSDYESTDLSNTLINPIIVGESLYGFFVIFNSSDLGELDHIAIDHAKTAVTLASIKKIRMKEIRQRIESEFFDDLLNMTFKDTATISKRAKNFGLDITSITCVIVVEIDNTLLLDRSFTEEKWMELNSVAHNKIKKELFKENYNNIVISHGDKIVILLCKDDSKQGLIKRITTFSESIIKTVHSILKSDVIIGVGNEFDTIMGISNSFQNGLKACEIGRKIDNQSSIHFYKNIQLFDRLDEFIRNTDMELWINRKLDKLNESDVKNNTELVKTFRCLIENAQDTLKVSELLFVHKNTVLNRKRKIIEIMELNPFDNMYRIQFEIAFLLKKMSDTERL